MAFTSASTGLCWWDQIFSGLVRELVFQLKGTLLTSSSIMKYSLFHLSHSHTQVPSNTWSMLHIASAFLKVLAMSTGGINTAARNVFT